MNEQPIIDLDDIQTANEIFDNTDEAIEERANGAKHIVDIEKQEALSKCTSIAEVFKVEFAWMTEEDINHWLKKCAEKHYLQIMKNIA